MIIRKVLFLIFFLFSSNFINASEIDGIKIFQSAEGFLKIDNSEWRKVEFNNDIKSYGNNVFNLSFNSEYRDNDFEIPNPDYFFKVYWIWEKEKEVIGILTYRPLVSKILQQNFKIGECEQLRNQLVLEKEVKFNKEIKKTKSKSYQRSAEENVIYFEDRLSFNYIINDINVTHNFSCYYEIHFEKDADLGKKHLVTASIQEEILETNFLNQYEIFDKSEEIEEFNSNYIKNFKIWGNINEIDYDEEEIFSLENYRLKSFQKHNEIKKQNEIKAKKDAEEEILKLKKIAEEEKIKAEIAKQKKIKEEKILKFKIEISKLNEEIDIKKEKYSKEVNLLRKPLSKLEDDLMKISNTKKNTLKYIENQKNSFKSNFYIDYVGCFPKSISKFVSPLESVYANLEFINDWNYSINYSINYKKFSDNDKSLFFFDFVKDQVTCRTDINIFDRYDALELKTINFRFFNKRKSFNLQIPEINKEFNNKLEKINKKITMINNYIKQIDKSIVYRTDQLTKEFNSEVEIIENLIKDVEKKIFKLDENYKTKLLISKKIDYKIDKKQDDSTKEKLVKKNKVTQVQDIWTVTKKKLTITEEQSLQAQFLTCWSIPLGLPYNKEDLLVRMKLSLNIDGTVAKIEILDENRMSQPGQNYYKVLVESVLRAIKTCEPLKIPTTDYEKWKEVLMNFDATEMLEG